MEDNENKVLRRKEAKKAIRYWRKLLIELAGHVTS
jgi:hypothetical protein